MCRLICGDCMELLPEIQDGSVDMVLCDMPYGSTQNTWDQKLPLDKLWEQYSRIVKEHGAICLFADGMFLADLMKSNRKMWRYNLIWDKVIPTGFLNANRMPLRRTEEIAVFYRKQPLYHPQKVPGKPNHSKGRAVGTLSEPGLWGLRRGGQQQRLGHMEASDILDLYPEATRL